MNGIVTTGIIDAKLESYSLVIQPDGKIVIAGSHYASLTGWDFMVARYNSDGEPDMDFGNNGIAITLIPSSTELGYDCALQENGKLIVGGEAYIGGASNFIITRYITDLELRLIDVSRAIENVLLYPLAST